MWLKCEHCALSAALMMGSAALAYSQAPAVQASTSLEKDVSSLKSENAALRQELQRVEQQQLMLLEVVNDLKQRLGPSATPMKAVVDPSAQENASIAAVKLVNAIHNLSGSEPPLLAERTPQAQPDSIQQKILGRYQDGIVVGQAPEDAGVPFLLKFQGTTQVRYLNTLDSKTTFTDHLGNVYPVHQRNDITVNRSMSVFNGYIFNPKAMYSFTVWTSAGAASIVVAGNVGWQFNKGLTLTGGYTGVPGSRSLVNTFPFFTANDRTMADNFFRPGFTQGVWASGSPGKGLNYLAFLGNSLNTLSIAANKIDTDLLVSGSVWWEPLGDYGPPGRSRNMYDDYYSSSKVRIRLGTAFTRARENRISDLDTSSPENTSIYNADGIQAFATGAFAPGVTLQDATYKMSAIDGGIKWNGLAANGQYFIRWLNDFVADGPLPVASTFDHGAELSVSYFVMPKKLMPYIRGSWVRGQFGDPYEYGAGLRWYYLPTERLWLNAEVFRITQAPYSGTFTPYTAGMSGWTPMIQAYMAF